MFYILFDRFNNRVVSNHPTLEGVSRADRHLQKSLGRDSYLPTSILKSPTPLQRGLHLDDWQWERMLISEEDWDLYMELDSY